MGPVTWDALPDDLSMSGMARPLRCTAPSRALGATSGVGSSKIVIVGATKAYGNGELEVVAYEGVAPVLPMYVMAELSDYTATPVAVE